MSEQCCICGKELPNRWAVAGRCGAKGCDAPFCSLHWRNGNRLCREHGWRPDDGGQRSEDRGRRADMDDTEHVPPINHQPSTNNDINEAKESDMDEENRNENMDLGQVPEEKGKKAVDAAVKAAKALGSRAAGLVAKIQYARSPQAMQDTLSNNLQKNTERREEVSAKLEQVHNRIVTQKKQYEAAPPARKRTLQMELKALMGEYKNLESEFKILLENEEVLGKVRGRFMETLAYDLRGISEKHVDKIADKIDEKADAAEGVMDAVADLDRAGRRRDREDDVDFDAELAAFGDEEISMADEAGETPAIPSRATAQPEQKKDPLDGLGEF
ncbi:MAG: hypothetical protein GXY61_12120 [Lentisphaerae bacterium]|nr:hypothetical protein [Lentisphaerota bacterium]